MIQYINTMIHKIQNLKLLIDSTIIQINSVSNVDYSPLSCNILEKLEGIAIFKEDLEKWHIQKIFFLLELVHATFNLNCFDLTQ